MNANMIRPIPKRIEKRIRELDKKFCPEQKRLRFYSYLTTIQKELVKITVAMRNNGKQTALIKQVAIHGVYSDKCLVKDMEYCYLGICAFRVGWFDEGIKYPMGRPFYNDGIWHEADFKYYNPYTPIINPNFPMRLQEFKYSAIDILKPLCPIKYLRTYLKYPQTEYLIKLGLKKFVDSKMILQRISKDKHFRKWLATNRAKLNQNFYYIDVIIKAYKTGKSLDLLQAYREEEIKLQRDIELKPIRKIFKGEELKRFTDYIAKQNTNSHSYLDYFNACEYLKLDMTEEKNRYPHDFKRWHNIRIDEYKTAKALKDKEERKALYDKFASIAQKYLALQQDKDDMFVVVIARSPQDLINEGEILHHCVGSMSYDQKFVREESLIFFIRDKQNPTVPFVTMEYSISQKKILQCYGDHDKKPNDNVMEFAIKKWLPYANKQLKKLQKTQAAA